MTGAELIAEERKRQVEKEGWTVEHDDEHMPGDLTAAARSYALYAHWQLMGKLSGWSKETCEGIILEEEWPWDNGWWKPSDKVQRNLEKAGALIAAEIDRLQRREVNGA